MPSYDSNLEMVSPRWLRTLYTFTRHFHIYNIVKNRFIIIIFEIFKTKTISKHSGENIVANSFIDDGILSLIQYNRISHFEIKDTT